MANEWQSEDHANAYLERADEIPHRRSGEQTLISELPKTLRRFLDLGCGDGRLLGLVLEAFPDAEAIGLDFSPTMLKESKQRFSDNSNVQILDHDLDSSLPDLGEFDAVVSSFAIHHCEHPRKREIYEEAWQTIAPGGVFANLEHIASPNEAVHKRFLAACGFEPDDEDPSNKLLDVQTQLDWLREIGFKDVDCYWKWRELALLIGSKP